jgi:hypothetical protein
MRPMSPSSQPPHAPPDPFVAYRRRTRNRALAGAVAVVVLIAGAAFVSWWRDPQRAIAKARPALDKLRAQYCKVYDAEKARAPEPARARDGAEPVRGLPYYFLDMKVWDHDEHPDANADTIELADLEAMCVKNEPRYGKGKFSSQLGKLLEPNAGDGARLDSTQKLLAAMTRVRYLFVARVTAFTPSIATGQSTMSPGHFAGTAAIYKLDDASLVAAASVNQNAPGAALVFGRQNAFGGMNQNDVQGSLDADTSLAFDGAFESSFNVQGVQLKMR